jgi:hypothetical protein
MTQMTLDAALPRTPLQQALDAAGDPAALHARHRARLQQLHAASAQALQHGLAPADYAVCRQRLAMCEAALRVLDTLAPCAARHAGPASDFPRPSALPG